MWAVYSLVALTMLVSRRSAEKQASGRIDSLGLSWLQQTVALPFIIGSLCFARFYWPGELSGSFWAWMALYVACISVDIFCYFRALSIADVSYIAPLMSLMGVGSIFGSYFILGQKPSAYGLLGSFIIVCGAIITYRAKHTSDVINRKSNRLATLLILFILVERSVGANIEVFMLRESNPTTFNFYSSFLTVPFLLLTTILLITFNKTGKYKGYWPKLNKSVLQHKLLLGFIGLTYTINMLATYQGKLVSPNAGYVTAIKSASVLPMMLIGFILFKEKIVRQQWIGLGLILVGLILLALN